MDIILSLQKNKFILLYEYYKLLDFVKKTCAICTQMKVYALVCSYCSYKYLSYKF